MSTLTSSQEELISKTVKEMVESLKTPTGSPTNVYAHGPGGLLSPLGMRRGLANAMILPSLGIFDVLPKRTSREENPLLGIFTGQTAATGDEPDGRCDDPRTAGQSKICTHTFTWGWFGLKSQEVRLDRFGVFINRGEFDDYTVVGNPFDAPDVGGGVEVPGQRKLSPSMVNTEYGKLMWELAVDLMREQARDLYSGNPANNTGTPGNGGREYYRGFDLLINTGYQDAITQQSCPAADSIVRDWNSVDISTDGNGIVRELTYIYRNLKYIATQAGLSPARWAISMRWGAFYELTEIWPCAYLSYRCNLSGSNASNSTNFISADRQTEMRDQMRGDIYNREGQFLLIDGERVPVVIDDSITEGGTGIGGQFVSDIYFVPLSVRGGNGGAPISEGGTAATYLEYFDFDMPGGTMDGARMMAPAGAYVTTPNKRYLFHKYYPKNLCVQIAGWNKPRLVLETPYLAARLQNVAYTPLIHEREPFTDDAYFVDGGNTNFLGYGPSYAAPTA